MGSENSAVQKIRELDNDLRIASQVNDIKPGVKDRSAESMKGVKYRANKHHTARRSYAMPGTQSSLGSGIFGYHRFMQTATSLQEWFGGIDIYVFDQLLKGRFVPGMRVLDAGCGAGRNLVYFLRSGYEVFGVDESEEAILQARKLASALTPHLPEDNLRVGPVERLSADYADYTERKDPPANAGGTDRTGVSNQRSAISGIQGSLHRRKGMGFGSIEAVSFAAARQ